MQMEKLFYTANQMDLNFELKFELNFELKIFRRFKI